MVKEQVMGKIMEVLFCIFYMIFVSIVGARTVINGKTKAKKENLWFGIMALVLVGGDAFYLIPRVLEAFDKAGNYQAAKGIGTLITSITMTLFYLLLYYIYSLRYGYKSKGLSIAMLVLTLIRIALCILPQNDWTGESPVIWGIYRNIPFLIMGIIMIVLFFIERSDKSYSTMYLAILLSFLFYIPVVLWADAYPVVGMFMLPKTCMYIWIVCMGYKVSKS